MRGWAFRARECQLNSSPPLLACLVDLDGALYVGKAVIIGKPSPAFFCMVLDDMGLTK